MSIQEKVSEFVEEVNAEFGADLEVVVGEEGEIAVNWPGHGHIYIGAESGEILPKTKITGSLVDKLRGALGQKPPGAAIATVRTSGRSEAPSIAPRDMPVRDIQVAELSLGDIKSYICPAATDPEAFMFLKLCQARNLNPFTNEAYLIKYGQKAQMVVGKEAFMRKAELHPQYAGFKAGVIVGDDKGLEPVYREGSFLRKGEELLGGWAEVYRKDRSHPIRAEVSLTDYDSGKEGPWKNHKATMIRKVPLVQAMREAFPSDLSGCYDSAEMRDAPDIIDIEGEMVGA